MVLKGIDGQREEAQEGIKRGRKDKIITVTSSSYPLFLFSVFRPLRSHRSFILCRRYSFFIANLVTNCFTLHFILTPLSCIWKNNKALMAGNGKRT